MITVVVVAAACAVAQETPAAKVPKATPAATKAKAAAGTVGNAGSAAGKAAPVAGKAAAAPTSDFAKLNAKFRTLVAELTQLRRRYQSDSSANKVELEGEWDQKIEEVKTLETQLASSAEQAYLAAPDKTPQEGEYLFAYLTSQLKVDSYEEAARIADLLAEHKYEHQFFDLVAGLAYFGIMEFDKAKASLTRAKDKKEIDETGMRYLSQIDDHHYAELWKKEQEIRAAEDQAGNLPRVKLTTSKGDIVIVLFENEAPLSTANFLELTEKKFFDGLKFHRVIPGFMAQGGDPKGDGTGGPGYTIPDECFQDNHRSHFRGTLSMANTGQRDTGGSQFFLTFLPTSHLDGKHTVFGRVVEGMDVLSKLTRCQPGDSAVPDRIEKATVLSKRNHPYQTIKRPDKS
jgi:cyclophilin family peptidyl-prolyl cis-trans isomerase